MTKKQRGSPKATRQEEAVLRLAARELIEPDLKEPALQPDFRKHDGRVFPSYEDHTYIVRKYR